jgi:hypothetical protein
MPSVVVALVCERNPEATKCFGEERLLVLAELLLNGYPPPRMAVEAIEAAFAVLHPAPL